MKASVVGIGQRRSGTAKATGNPYDGKSVYILSAASDVQGHKASELYFNYLSAVTYPEVAIGDTISVERNDKGFVEEVSVISKKA